MTNTAVGPLGFRAEVDINPKGEKSILPRTESAGRADSTSILDENNPEPSRIVPHESESGAQGPPYQGHHIMQEDEPTMEPEGTCQYRGAIRILR